MIRITVSIFFIFILACASRSEPEWMKTQPKVEGYWFGIGTVQAPFYENSCREAARNKALSEISTQISVEISGSFDRVITEHNLNLDEITKSIIKTRVDNTLPNIEIMEFYNSKERCGLLVRLSQSVYYETIERQRRNAVQSALGLLTQAESDFNVQTFAYLSEALSEIIPYMDIPIEEEYPLGSGRIVNLYSYIKVQTNKSISRLILVPDNEIVEMKRGFNRDLQLGLRVVDKKSNTPIENIPVICYINTDEQGSFALSDANGDCIFPVPKIRDEKSIQFINFEMNMPEILQNHTLFGVLTPIQVQTTLKVIAPKINIQITENNLGESTINPYIQPVISEFFSRYYSANFVDTDDADIIIQGMVNTRSLSDFPNDYGIYQVFGDLTIFISKGETGETLLEKSFNKVQGSDFQSNREAANQSLKKMSKKITEEFLPELIDIIEGY